MIILARGSGLGLQLQGVLERHWGAGNTRPIAYVPSIEDLAGVATTSRNPAGRPVSRKQFLVVDVDTCADGSAQLSEWMLDHRDVLPVLIMTRFVPQQMRFMDRVKSAEPRAVQLCGEEAGTDLVWDRVFRHQLSFRVGPQIHKDLGAIRALSPTAGAVLLAAPETGSSVEELCAAIPRDRRGLERELKRTGQRSPKELLVLFRALYHAKLRELEWLPANIARYLGHDSPEACHRELARGLRLSTAALLDLPYRRLLALVAAVLPARGGPVEHAVHLFLTTPGERSA